MKKEFPKRNFIGVRFILEIISQCIFPWPWYDCIIFMPQLQSSGVDHVPYFLSEFFMIFMFVRLYGVLRHFERYHEFSDITS